jgi:putative transposase
VHLTLMSLHVHGVSQLPALHAALRAGDLLLADRGFCSYWHLAMLAKSSVFAVFRMHQRQIVDFTPGRPHRPKNCKRSKRGGDPAAGRGMPASRYVRRLGHEDQLVEWARPAGRPAWMTAAEYALMPATLLVRELRYRVEARGRRTRVVTVATTLLDPVRYPKREVARLYGLRWEVETDFNHLKTTTGMDRLKCQTADGVFKELMVFVLVYNLVRAAMLLAAARQGIAANRVSFVDALRRLRSRCRAPAIDGPLNLVVNPVRPGRWHPRVLKRRTKPYDLMNRPRSAYAEPPPAEEVIA